jgi:hypothetical protein
MKKKVFAICLSVVVLVALIAVLVSGCTGEQCIGEIEVKATLCDAPWEGPVNYTLTGPGATAPTVINGNNVTALFDDVDCGDWTCAYVSGGPPGAYLVDITPNPTQTLTSGGNITFTLNFELDQDAWIESVGETWTINGIPIEQYPEAHYEDGYWYADVTWCDVIDVHYTQGVDGCEGRLVTLNETDELEIHYAWPEGEPILVEVLNDWCAVNKTATPEGPPPEKLGQVPSYMGDPVEPHEEYPLPYCMNVTLDVETSWELVKEINYIKEIRWLHIGECYDPPCDWCVLFNLLAPGPGFGFEMRSRAAVALVDDVDVDPENNSTGWSTPLRLTLVG